MAAKCGVPVCPHAGGVGLCEYVQHLSIFDYVAVSGGLEHRVLEYVDHLHEHFVHPVTIKNGNYVVPETPGYSIAMHPASLDRYEYPGGAAGGIATRYVMTSGGPGDSLRIRSQPAIPGRGETGFSRVCYFCLAGAPVESKQR